MDRSPDGHKSLVVPATVGAGVGGGVVGLLVGALGILAFSRWRRHNKHRENPNRDSFLSSNSSRNRREMTTTGGQEYIVEPFGVPSTLRPSSPSNPGVPLSPGGNMTSPTSPASRGSSDPVDQSGRRPNVYVVHHDGGRAPVTVYTEEGAAVVELPPQYAAGSTGSPSESEASREVDRREPGTTPRVRKTREPRSS